MKKKIIKVLDNLTDEFVPDNKEAILNAISNENSNNPVEYIPKKKFRLKYISIAACFALLLLSILTVNLFNTDVPFTMEGNSSNSSNTSISEENPRPNENFIQAPVFNNGELNALKIGGTVEKTTQEEVEKVFVVNSLPYDLEYSFLYGLSSDSSTPFACILQHRSSDKWFKCIVSSEKLVDCSISEYEYTYAGNIKIIFSTNGEYLYASFSVDEMNFLLESEGFSENDFIGIVNLLIY